MTRRPVWRSRAMAWARPSGDYDNDGDVDLFVSAVGQNRLFRNDGGGSWK